MTSHRMSWLEEAGIDLSDWFERWFPDAFSFAIVGLAVVFCASLAAGNSAAKSVEWFGAGYWDLVKFTMQMTLIIVSGYAVASAPPVHRVIENIASIPRTPKGAVAFIALFSMLSSLLSWSFSLIFSGFLAKEVAHRVKGTDYRAAGAAAYLGLCSISMMGLSSSAALIMANPGSLPASLAKISGTIPLDQTIFLWQGGVVVAAILLVSVALAYWSAPDGEHARDMASLGVAYHKEDLHTERPKRPGEWLDYHPLLTIVFGGLGAAYILSIVAAKGVKELLELNNYIFTFLVAGLWLHWRPRSFMNAIAKSVPAAAGILIQYPIYASILKLMTESGLATKLAHFFVNVSSADSYPLLVALYSTVLGFFIPSAGGKWLIEAPYLLEAATQLRVHLGWVVQVYNAAEALPIMIHPFWMLPVLGILNLKARDIVGYSAIQFIVHTPLVLFLVWALNYTLVYVAPAISAAPGPIVR